MSFLGFMRGGKARERIRQAKALLELVERIVSGARTVQEKRERLARSVEQGDLDGVISWAHKRDKRVANFIEGRGDG